MDERFLCRRNYSRPMVRVSFLRSLLASCVLWATAIAPFAFAEDSKAAPKTADTLFWEGRRAADAGDLATACSKFTESLALERAAGTLFNLALCEDRKGLVASAARHYQEAANRMKGDDQRAAVARGRAATLDLTLPRLLVLVKEKGAPGLRVTVDGKALAEEEFGVAQAVDPGEHVVRLTAEGREPNEVKVTVAEKQTRDVPMDLGPLAKPKAAAPQTGKEAPGPLAPGAASSKVPTVGWAVAGVGGGALVFGAIATGLLTQEAALYQQKCPQGACLDQSGLDAANRGRTWQQVSTLSFVTGGAAVALGVTLVVYAAVTGPAKPTSVGKPQAATALWHPQAPTTLHF